MRMLKINSEIKKSVSKIIDTELRSSNLTGLITVNEVDTAKDFSNAKIYITILGAKSKKNTMEALNHSKGYIRSRIAKELNFRKMPELIFIYDESVDYGTKIDAILEEINKENKSTEEQE